jgi:hypothetical protein
VSTVQLLLQAGGWVPATGFACLLNAVRARSTEVVELLYAARAAATAAATATAGVISNSSSDKCCISGTFAGGFTLMHIAAVTRSLSCAEVLLRHGVPADLITDVRVVRATTQPGLSPLDLLVLTGPMMDLNLRCYPPVLEPAVFDKFALMLLSCGATITHTAMKGNEYSKFARALQQHSERQQQQVRSRARVAAVHAAACWQESDSCSSGGSSVVQVRLVHAVTQQRGAKLYTIDTKLLAQLYASAVTAAAATDSSTSTTAATIVAQALLLLLLLLTVVMQLALAAVLTLVAVVLVALLVQVVIVQ